eukprot:1156484-Pelagomonas_calceolata.AAC.2
MPPSALNTVPLQILHCFTSTQAGGWTRAHLRVVAVEAMPVAQADPVLGRMRLTLHSLVKEACLIYPALALIFDAPERVDKHSNQGSHSYGNSPSSTQVMLKGAMKGDATRASCLLLASAPAGPFMFFSVTMEFLAPLCNELLHSSAEQL